MDIAFKGVLAADLPNGMKAGEKLQFYGASGFKFKDGRLDEITDSAQYKHQRYFMCEKELK